MDRHSVETTVLLFVAEYCVLWRGTLGDGLHIWDALAYNVLKRGQVVQV